MIFAKGFNFHLNFEGLSESHALILDLWSSPDSNFKVQNWFTLLLPCQKAKKSPSFLDYYPFINNISFHSYFVPFAWTLLLEIFNIFLIIKLLEFIRSLEFITFWSLIIFWQTLFFQYFLSLIPVPLWNTLLWKPKC